MRKYYCSECGVIFNIEQIGGKTRDVVYCPVCSKEALKRVYG